MTAGITRVKTLLLDYLDKQVDQNAELTKGEIPLTAVRVVSELISDSFAF